MRHIAHQQQRQETQMTYRNGKRAVHEIAAPKNSPPLI
jgi:hypothetical protein